MIYVDKKRDFYHATLRYFSLRGTEKWDKFIHYANMCLGQNFKYRGESTRYTKARLFTEWVLERAIEYGVISDEEIVHVRKLMDTPSTNRENTEFSATQFEQQIGVKADIYGVFQRVSTHMREADIPIAANFADWVIERGEEIADKRRENFQLDNC